MTGSAWILFVVMLSFSLSSLLIWYWSKQKGLAHESIKYRMLEDDEDA